MKKLNLLSIDWDWFVRATLVQRMQFPDGGNENLAESIQNYAWALFYARIDGTKVTFDKRSMAALRVFLSKRVDSTRTVVFIARSHREAFQAFSPMSNSIMAKDIEINLWNIDEHSDIYVKDGEDIKEVNCGNWLEVLRRTYELDGVKANCNWVCNDDELDNPLDLLSVGKLNKISMDTFLKFPKDVKFDAIFLCRSDPWSPPHLDKEYILFARFLQDLVKNNHTVMLFEGEKSLKSRYSFEFKKAVKSLIPVYDNVKRMMKET